MNESIHAPDFPYDFQWINTSHPLSLYDDLQGYVILVHFWTSSNVNCHHVFSTVSYLEQRFVDRSFIVVGVHTGKFSAERDPDHVSQAARRFGLRHPIVVDEAGEIWKSFEARAWPYVCLIDATGHLRFQGSGEPDLERTASAIEFLLDEAAAEGDEPYTQIRLEENDVPTPLQGLRFPAGVAFDTERGRLWIVDSARHRVVAIDPETGEVQAVIGSGAPGASDGEFETASFFQPQSLLVSGDAVFVADAGNHLIRRIDLNEGRVDSVLGTNRSVVDRDGGGSGPSQPINSPWGMARIGDELFVAMAGQNQIWRVELDTMTAAPFAGNDTKGVFDGPVYDASLAQPAGLAVSAGKLWFVDSDSSSLRSVDFSTGEVSSPIPGGVYAWGATDGETPKMQFPRDLAFHNDDLLIADTFNDKVRRWRDGQLDTLTIDLSRPEGLAVEGDTLYIADTGNHRIVKVDLTTADDDDLALEVLQIEGLPPVPTGFGTEWVTCAPIELPPLGEGLLRLPMNIASGAAIHYETRATLDAENIEGHPLLVDVTVHPDVDGEEFIARGIATGDEGEGVVRLKLVYLTCEEPGQVCHPHEQRLDVPVSIVAGAGSEADDHRRELTTSRRGGRRPSKRRSRPRGG